MQAGTYPGAQSVSGVNKLAATGVDDTVAVWSAACGYQLVNSWRLTASPGIITVPHGAITQVRLYARMYLKQDGQDYWSDDSFPWPRPHYAQFVKINGVYTWRTAESYGGYQVGTKVLGNLNANNPGTWGPTTVAWDITALASWTDSLVNTMQWGLACDGADLGGTVRAGLNVATYLPMTNSEHRVSQLVVRVTADDPPVPPPLINQGMVGE